MKDLLYLLVTGAFLLICISYVRGLNRI